MFVEVIVYLLLRIIKSVHLIFLRSEFVTQSHITKSFTILTAESCVPWHGAFLSRFVCTLMCSLLILIYHGTRQGTFGFRSGLICIQYILFAWRPNPGLNTQHAVREPALQIHLIITTRQRGFIFSFI